MLNCHLVALATWALLFFIGFHNHRTFLAQTSEATEAAGPQKPQEFGEDWFQISTQKSEAGRGDLEIPSQLERKRVSTAISHESHESMEMPNVCHHEFELSCVLQAMPIPLETSMEEATRAQQESEEAAGQQSQATAEASPRAARRGLQHEPLSGQAPLGSEYTQCAVEQAWNGEGGQPAIASTTSATRTASGHSTGLHGRGQPTPQDLARPPEIWHGFVNGTDQQDGRIGEEKQGIRAAEGALTWIAAQEDQGREATGNDHDKDQHPRCRMAKVHRGHSTEDLQPCPDVHSKSSATCILLQGQEQRIAVDQRGDDNRLTAHDWEDHGSSRPSRSPQRGCANEPNARSHAKGDPSDIRRRHGSRTDSRLTDDTWRQGYAETWAKKRSSFPGINIASQSGESVPEGKNRTQKHMTDMVEAQDNIDHSEVHGIAHRIDNSPNDSPEGSHMTSTFDVRLHSRQGRVSSHVQASSPDALRDDAIDELLRDIAMSSNEIDASLSGQFEWHALTNGLVTECEIFRDADRSNCRVSFCENVEVHIFHHDKTASFRIAVSQTHQNLRRCWSIAGHRSSWSHCQYVLHSVQQQESLPNRVQDREDQPIQLERHRLYDQEDGLPPEVWHRLINAQASQRRVRRVETWFVNEGHVEVCKFPRTVTITPQMTMAEFEFACRQIWRDTMHQADVEWFVVENPPQSAGSVVAHIILVQNRAVKQQVHLIHWDRWPILGKFRAVMFPNHDTVRNALLHAQAFLPRNDPNAIFGMHCQVAGRALLYSQDDEIQIHNSVVMYAFVQHVPIEEDTSGTESVDSSVSTRTPNDALSEYNTDEVLFMQTDQIISHFDSVGPYPWENSMSDEELEGAEDDQSSDDAPHMSEETMFQMQQHASFVLSTHPHVHQQWVAITFGLGLTSLGRRDVDFTIDELPQLHQKIGLMWNDHARYGEATIHFVTPQPEGLHIRRNLVFIISIEYGQEHDTRDRKVLIREASKDGSVISQHPYAAHLLTGMTPRGMLSQLQHHECFPFGVRDCGMRVAGRWLASFQHYAVHNGDLCDVLIGEEPAHVLQADNQMSHAEDMFRVARAHFENLPHSTMLTLRVHGISPSNVPLGHRDMHTDYPDMINLEWISRMKQLWPFRDDIAALHYVPQGISLDEFDEERPIMHFILNYVSDREGVAVLVRQHMFAVSEMISQRETWATVIPQQADETTLTGALRRYPFWFHPQVRTHIKKGEAALTAEDVDWSNGDVISLRFNVMSREKMLVALLEMENRRHHPPEERNMPYDEEEVTLLQTRYTWTKQPHDQDEVNDQLTENCQFSQPEACIEIFQACIDDKVLQPFSDHAVQPSLVSCTERQQWPKEKDTGAHTAPPCNGTRPDAQLDSLDEVIGILRDPSWQGLNLDFEMLPPLHPAAMMAIQSSKIAGNTGHGGVFHIYTDGSSKEDSAAWSFIVLHQISTCHGPRFLRVGYAAGPVNSDLGDFATGAADAEATALIAVAEYLLSRRDLDRCEIHIHYDAQAVGAGAEGKQRVPGAAAGHHGTRAEFARIMISLVQQLATAAEGHHVHAHDWNPYNEAVDSIAQHVRKGWCPHVSSHFHGT